MLLDCGSISQKFLQNNFQRRIALIQRRAFDVHQPDHIMTTTIISKRSRKYKTIFLQSEEEKKNRVAMDNNILKAISVLQQKAKFPVLLREKIEELAKQTLDAISIFEQDSTSPSDFVVRKGIDLLIHTFLQSVEDMLQDIFYANDGLKRNRDSYDEVEFAIRCFPRILSAKVLCGRSLNTHCAIMFQAQPDLNIGTRNVNCMSFVPLLARMGIELGQFEKDQRGGLLFKDIWSGNNVLQMLAATNLRHHNLCYSEQHEIIDDLYLDAIKRLREMNLFKKEDLREYFVLHRMCDYLVLPRKRFLYLVDWDPTTLSQPDMHGRLPLHYWASISNILGLGDFRTVLKAGIRHLSVKEGIGMLFYKDNTGVTPFQLTFKPSLFHLASMECWKVEDVTKGIEHSVDTEAFLFACLNEQIHVDGVYFLLRRQPELLLALSNQTQRRSAAMIEAIVPGKKTSVTRRMKEDQETPQTKPNRYRDPDEYKKRKRTDSSINHHPRSRRFCSAEGSLSTECLHVSSLRNTSATMEKY